MKKIKFIPFACLVIVGLFLTTDIYARHEESRHRKHKSEETVVVVEQEFPPLIGPKKTIAVMDFENKAGVPATYNLGTGMAEMLTTALVNTGRFIVVERQAIQDVLAEQDFGASGRTTTEGAADFGKILNSQILIRGAVTEFEMNESGGGTAFRIKGFDLGVSGSQAHVGVNVRVYDATTGQVIDSVKCDGKASTSGLSVGYSESDWGIGTSGFQSTPLGKATQDAIDQAVYFIVQKMNAVTWQGKVVTFKDNLVFINCGQDSNVKIGDEFTVYKSGEQLIDPDTGIVLGSEQKKIGRIQVVEVADKFSKATITSGGGIERGDIVRFD